jgi:hypothetical protein
MDEIDWEITQIKTPKRIQLDYSQSFGFSKEHIDVIKNGFVPKTLEDKWYIYSKDDWLFFHRAWTGYGIYKLEIKHINGRYIIDDFYVERNIDKYENLNDLFDIHILHVIIDWGLLGVDCRFLYLKLFNNSENDSVKLWHILGNFFISLSEIEEYNIERAKKYPCKEVFKVFNEKIELFLGFLENLHYYNIIPVNEFKDLLIEFSNLAIKMERTNRNISFLIKKESNKNNILENINVNYSFILWNINKIKKANLKYFKIDNRKFLLDEIIDNLINNSGSIKIEKAVIEKLLSYKTVINNDIFNDQYIIRFDND